MVKDENKCGYLLKKYNIQLSLGDIFALVSSYQKKMGIDWHNMDAETRVRWVKEYILALTMEQAELLDRLPWKKWRNYTKNEMQNFFDPSNILESYFEWVDSLFFLIDQALILGINADKATDLFMSKLKENLNRIHKGYNKNKNISL